MQYYCHLQYYNRMQYYNLQLVVCCKFTLFRFILQIVQNEKATLLYRCNISGQLSTNVPYIFPANDARNEKKNSRQRGAVPCCREKKNSTLA